MHHSISVVTQSSTNGNGHDLLQRSEPTPTGFTAVNGDKQRSSSFHSREPSRQPTAQRENHAIESTPTIPVPAAAHFHSHGWRADSRTMSEHPVDSPLDEPTNAKKRKRSDLEGAEAEGDVRSGHAYGSGAESPKRRMTNMDSAIDLSSPDRSTAARGASPPEGRPAEPITISAYSR